MNLVLGFAPFILFFLLSRISADLALWVAFAAAFVVTIRDFVESPSLRLLDVGNLVVFGSLALVRGPNQMPVQEVNLIHVQILERASCVDGSRLLVAVVGVAGVGH